MVDTVVWMFQSLFGDSGMKYGVSCCLGLCYEIMFYVGIVSLWTESLCLGSQHLAVYTDLSCNTLVTLGWSCLCWAVTIWPRIE